MARVTLFFALLEFLSPAHRGGLLRSVILFFKMGTVAGYQPRYQSSGIHRIENSSGNWLLWRFLVYRVFVDRAHLEMKSSGAVPFTTIFALLVLLFPISVPLEFLGLYIAVRETGKAPSANQQYSTSHIGNLFDGSIVSRDHLHRVLHTEPLLFETEIFCYSALHDHVSSARPVVWDCSTSCVPRSILCYATGSGGAPNASFLIPRQFPEQQFMQSTRILGFVCNIVPFCPVYTDLFFIMYSLCQISSIDSSIY